VKRKQTEVHKIQQAVSVEITLLRTGHRHPEMQLKYTEVEQVSCPVAV
jgi:hypothetical protein